MLWIKHHLPKVRQNKRGRGHWEAALERRIVVFCLDDSPRWSGSGGSRIFFGAAKFCAGKAARGRIVDPAAAIPKDPQVIIVSWCGAKVKKKAIRRRPGWSEISAVRDGRIYEVNHLSRNHGNQSGHWQSRSGGDEHAGLCDSAIRRKEHRSQLSLVADLCKQD